ncbi:MAG: HEAT repeat domain-containing protein, partial [Nanoarchaeota archaeon]|nr:HEAT repeat domain-containing protein [Nanoarchaeota archaeon]
MLNFKKDYNLKIISLIISIVFLFNSTLYSYPLSKETLRIPSSFRNPDYKRRIHATLLSREIIYADSEDAKNLLRTNHAEALLLSSGKYLVTKEVADNELKLIRAVTHEDIEALMQIIAKEDSNRYQAIKELILNNILETYNSLFPNERTEGLPLDLLINHIIAKVFELMFILDEGMVTKEELSPKEAAFIETIRPIIMANKHNYFTEKFYDLRLRQGSIKDALNKGMVFYQVAAKEDDIDHEVKKIKTLIKKGMAAVPALIVHSRSDEYREPTARIGEYTYPVRNAAIKALGKIGNKDAAIALVDLLTDKNIYVRQCAASALDKIRSNSKDRIALSIANLYSEDSGVREKAIRNLGKIGAEEALEVLETYILSVSLWIGQKRYVYVGERYHGHVVYREYKDKLTGHIDEHMDYPVGRPAIEEMIEKEMMPERANPEHALVVDTIQKIKQELPLKGREEVSKSQQAAGSSEETEAYSKGIPPILQLKDFFNVEISKHQLELLYGKKAFRLAEMIKLRLPVPDGFVITSDSKEKEIATSMDSIITGIEKQTGKKLEDKDNPLRLAVRSSPSQSMPGLLLTKTDIKTKKDLFTAIKEVMASWNEHNAEVFRELNDIQGEGTAVIIQPMVFGDKNNNSASGVLFTRDIMTGENKLTGRFSVKRKGEDIVARKDIQTQSIDELNKKFPEVYSELAKIKGILEAEFKNVQEVEFVMEDGKLWILQDRDAVISSQVQARVAVDMASEGLITQFAMLNKIIEAQDSQRKKTLYHIREGAKLTKIGNGLPSSPGAVQGSVAFSLEKVKEFRLQNRIPILVASKRPEEIETAILSGEIGGILTQYGHEALHESVLARSQGIPLIDTVKNATFEEKAIVIGEHRLEEGSEIILDGSEGEIYITEEVNVLEEDRTVSILGVDFDYTADAEEVRAKYKSYTYEELLSEHARLIASIEEVKEVTLQNLHDNLVAHVIHQLIFEKGEILGKETQKIDKDIRN